MVAAETVELRAQVKRLTSSYERLKAKNEALCRALDRSKLKIVSLGNSVAEGRKREKSLAEILRAISHSRTDAQPVFDAIARAALRLIGDVSAAVTRLDGDTLHLAALTSTSKRGDERLKAQFPCPVSKLPEHARAIRLRIPYCVSDSEKTKKALPHIARARGWRSAIFVPLLRGKTAIGTISVSRRDPGAFSDHDIELLKTFADQAVIAIENVRLFKELQARNAEVTEALEQQTATAEILRVISTSPTDTQPVFDAIVASGLRFFPDGTVSLRLIRNDHFETAATTAPHGDFVVPLNDGKSASSRSVLRREAVQIPDFDNAPEWVGDALKEQAARFNWRALLGAPLLRENGAIGVIGVSRPKPGAFSDKEVALLQTFANQAVIAIENVRLFKELQTRNAELTQSLERQTATAEVLKIISRSTFDLEPVLQALVDNAARLCRANRGVLFRQDGDVYPLAASYNATSELQHLFQANPIVPGRGTVSGRAMLERQAVHVADVLADPDYQWSEAARVGNYRTVLGVPLLREGIPIGVMGMTRDMVEPFTDQEIALVTTFADQAVIAIENVRLFKALQARNTELTESLEQQTATAEILRVISQSPTDVQPVFDAIAESATRLCESLDGVIFRRDGDRLVLVAHCGPIPLGPIGEFTLPLDRGNVPGRSIIDGQIIHVADLQAASGEFPEGSEVARQTGFRTALGVPLMREGVAIGAIGVRRAEAQPFSGRQVALLKTFADQSVIAIENVRLFRELEARNRALTESLARQTATADILKIISTNLTDVQPVLVAVAESAARLCGADDVVIRLVEGDTHRPVAHYGTLGVPAVSRPIRSGPATGRALLERRTIHIEDTALRDEYEGHPMRSHGVRTFLAVPLLREDKAIGAMVLRRLEVNPFSATQIELLETFAAQAVIAIENVRLFEELQARNAELTESLEQQTVTSEILRIISSSPTDPQPVFDAIVRSGVHLFAGMNMTLRLVRGDHTEPVASTLPLTSDEDLAAASLSDDRLISIRAMRSGEVMQISDIPTNDWVAEWFKERAVRRGFRAILSAPMMKDGVAIGVINVMRATTGLFTDREIALLKTFADQAVIAIENVRLFKELQAQTEALSRSVKQLTALGEVGQAISSSLDLETVLRTIVSRALLLTGLDSGTIYEYDPQAQVFRLQAAENMPEEIIESVRDTPVRMGDGIIGRIGVTRELTQVPDILDQSYQSTRRADLLRAGYRALLAVPLLRDERLLGVLLVHRKSPGEFAPEVVDLLKTFATQSALAIQNARLFREIAEKGRQLEVASQHKSQFLASMSHELRTPLNAILGFNEMMLDGLYGELPEDLKDPLQETQTSGRHLLRLINNVLDLAKIEAGRMELALADYSVHDMVESVRSTLRPLAEAKGLEFNIVVPSDIPLAYGDAGRLTQSLMNLAGNSLKFTKAGQVAISVAATGDTLAFRVVDTGIGIAPEKIDSLFTEFKQTDATIASEYGGTGLGLAITRQFIEMHGGRIWVESEPGKGSTFIFEIPLRAQAT